MTSGGTDGAVPVNGSVAPGRRIRASAPVRVADVGGWTDTWFGGPGRVCSIAVRPGVSVDATVIERRGSQASVRLRAASLGLDMGLEPSPDGGWSEPRGGTGHPLLAHAVREGIGTAGLPDELGIELCVDAGVPPGASLGTSASVVVALLGALDALTGRRRPLSEVATTAHRVETVGAGREAGIGDQWAAAVGGCQLLVIDDYPTARSIEVTLDEATAAALDERLVTVVFGPHDSSAVHRQVIDSLDQDPPSRNGVLGRLAALAASAAEALGAADLERWGRILTAATDLQGALHPDLIGAPHRAAIAVAREAGAAGWKVNGAGGAGGSLTILASEGRSDEVRAALAGADPSWVLTDLHVGRGLDVREIHRSGAPSGLG